jgi:imidazolonepropionase-like amidohydrolase
LEIKKKDVPQVSSPFLFLFPVTLILSQTYITNVTIADVENQKLIPHQTVIISGDKISEIQAADKVSIPANAIVVAGAGKYLFPGLTDAHVHFSQTGGLYTRPDAIDLREFKPYQRKLRGRTSTWKKCSAATSRLESPRSLMLEPPLIF